jgi:mono/diheme cytochrome c family protein
MLSPAMIDAGRKIFHGKGTCHGCHGDKLQGGPVAPALTGPSWRHITGTFDAIIDRVDSRGTRPQDKRAVSWRVPYAKRRGVTRAFSLSTSTLEDAAKFNQPGRAKNAKRN